MKTWNTVLWLGALIVVLALVAAGIGLLYDDSGSTFAFTTLRGETRQIYGHGLYRYDTPLGAVQNKAGDAVVLVLGIPLLVVALVLYRRGSMRGGIVLAGTLANFLYIYGSLALGAAYNNFFIIYVVLFSASLFALIATLASFELASLPARFSNAVPRRGMIAFLIASAISLLIVWLGLSLVPALVAGRAPDAVEPYATFMTVALDLGVLVPVLLIAARLLARRAALGYLLGATVVLFTVALGTLLIVAGIAQLLTAVITIGQFVGMTLPFAILTLVAVWLSVLVLRSITEPSTVRPVVTAGAGELAV